MSQEKEHKEFEVEALQVKLDLAVSTASLLAKHAKNCTCSCMDSTGLLLRMMEQFDDLDENFRILEESRKAIGFIKEFARQNGVELRQPNHLELE